MSKVMQTLFFSNIGKEADFSRSQTTSLTVVRNRLSYLLPLVGRHSLQALLFTVPIIDPEIPNKDAQNLEGLKLYSERLGNAERDLLYRELFLVATLQAGAISKAASQSFCIPRTSTGAEESIIGTLTTASTPRTQRKTLARPAHFFVSSPRGSTHASSLGSTPDSRHGSTPGSDPSQLFTPTLTIATPKDLAVIVDDEELHRQLDTLSLPYRRVC